MTFICTVHHTGSKSLIAETGYFHMHCSYPGYERARKGERVITTLRDPLRVAASWYNRNERNPKHWYTEWHYFNKILPYAEIVRIENLIEHLNPHPDKYGLHGFLDEEDMKGYYSVVDKDWVKFAKECMIIG